MTETQKSIIELGEMLIRTRGFHGFSYKDISEPMGIKNAAIHYHFPSKTDLGVAIIEKNIQGFQEHIKLMDGLPEDVQVRQFLEKVYLSSHEKGWVCISGALSPVFETLPAQMQEKISIMGENVILWLTGILKSGKEKNLFLFQEAPEIKAQLMVSSLLSSLLLSKTLGKEIFENIFSAVIKSL